MQIFILIAANELVLNKNIYIIQIDTTAGERDVICISDCDGFLAGKAGKADRAWFAEFETACDNVPQGWWSVDNGVPTSFNRDAVRELLKRFMNNDFWRIA